MFIISYKSTFFVGIMTYYTDLCAFTLRVGREPAFLHPVFLLEEFVDGPEAGEGGHSRNACPQGADKEQRQGTEEHSGQSEGPPATLAEMVLSLDHYRMKETYYEEGRETYDYA